MIGIDTTFLVQLEIVELDLHQEAKSFLKKHLAGHGRFALAPQVINEYLHIITDHRRFKRPLTMDSALKKADTWWHAREVQPVFPNRSSASVFFDWMIKYSLDRKRILDTYLAATYFSNNIREVITTNVRDYRVLAEMQTIELV